MKSRLAQCRWMLMALPLAAGVVHAAPPPDNAAQKAVAETREALRRQGFKTDLSEFDFATSPELRAREAVLKATAPDRNPQPFLDHPDLMEPAENNMVVVVWKQSWLKRRSPSWPDNSEVLTWDDFRQVINQKQPQMDAACTAILAGPIQFNLDAAGGSYMLLPHLALLKNLTQSLDGRVLLALHDGNLADAWTNLLAATRLVTAWRAEPAEVSRLVRFDDAKLVFDATWQALQTNGWTDAQLARLQQEWESAGFLADLPEIAAFRRACDVKALEFDELQSQRPGAQTHNSPHPSFGQIVAEAISDPYSLWEQMQNQWHREEYFRGGMYEDEQRLLLFDRDREVDLRNAVQAPTWKQMRAMPGVTNEIAFQAKYPHGGRFGSLSNQRRMNLAFERHGTPFLGCAAEAEAERRIVITALALERYRANHGAYPPALAALAPQFLKSAPVDFMDGRPLRYRLAADGHFLLYSVGLDCVDNGGKMPPPRDQANYFNPLQPARPQPESDLVWPLPASSGQAVARREKESKALRERMAQVQARAAEQEAQRETARQAEVKELLARKPPFNKTDPVFRGKPLSRFLQNNIMAKTKPLTLDQLLSIQQIGSGDLATFEVPVSYEAVTNIGELRLLVDGGGGGELQECNRATNGDCLLVWNTTYDPPGQHALQAQLHYGERRYSVEQLEVTGPVTPFYSTNVVQFFEGNSLFTDKGATLYAKLPEPHGIYTIELQTPEGKHLKTISGVTSNGVINVDWDLRDDQGIKYAGNSINAVFNVTLPDSGRSQTVKGP